MFLGWPTGILIDATKGEPTDKNIPAKLLIQNTIIAGSAKSVDYAASPTTPTGWATADALTWFNNAASGNSIFANNDEVKLAAAFNYGAPDVTPQAGSPALNGSSFTNAKLSSGFAQVNFRGAVGTSGTEEGDWWKGWSKF